MGRRRQQRPWRAWRFEWRRRRCWRRRRRRRLDVHIRASTVAECRVARARALQSTRCAATAVVSAVMSANRIAQTPSIHPKRWRRCREGQHREADTIKALDGHTKRRRQSSRSSPSEGARSTLGIRHTRHRDLCDDLDAAGRDEEAHVVGGDAAKLLGEAAFERLLTKGGEVSGDCEVGAENVKVGSPGRRGWQQWRR